MEQLAGDNVTMRWPDTFAWDDSRGELLFVSNRLNQFLDGRLQLNETNFRVWSVPVSAKSYLSAASGVTCGSSLPSPSYLVFVIVPAVLVGGFVLAAVVYAVARSASKRGGPVRLSSERDGSEFRRL